MRILVTGASGFVGRNLVPFLMTRGYSVSKLVRAGTQRSGEMEWDPDAGILNAFQLEGFDAIIHLAGENIANSRWTEEKKKRILDSRVIGTRLLCQALFSLKSPPKVLISASAIGCYGSSSDDAVLNEQCKPGRGFLADVCREWEHSSQQVTKIGVRVVNPRIGMILSASGGALSKMLIPFRMGLGGRLGSGRQYMSWVAMDDVINAIHAILLNEAFQGPVNVVSPHPVTNAEFTHTLGKVLHRPTLLPLPAFMVRLIFGELADEVLLSSLRVEPRRLIESGYSFLYPDLEQALTHLLVNNEAP